MELRSRVRPEGVGRLGFEKHFEVTIEIRLRLGRCHKARAIKGRWENRFSCAG